MKFVKKIVALLSVLALLIATFSAMAVFAAPEQGSDLVIGDADLDGEVTIKDVTCIQKVLAGINEKPDSFDYVADVTGDGKVDIRDVTTIQLYINGNITKFPVDSSGDETQSTTQSQSIDPTLTDPDGWYYPIYKP
ncbi:MAG: dockerin type I repeat-containing protein [Ruminococcus sp.]